MEALMKRAKIVGNKQTNNTYKKIFSDNEASTSLRYDRASLVERPLTFWRNADKRRLELFTQQSVGPRNAWEEQIEWTKQGKMWPYPIDNEYLLGEEEHVICFFI